MTVTGTMHHMHANELQTFSFAKCSKQTKQIGTEMLLDICADSSDGNLLYIA